MRVRWSRVSGMSEWVECKHVEARPDWLMIVIDDHHTTWIPSHVVRGAVEVDTSTV